MKKLILIIFILFIFNPVFSEGANSNEWDFGKVRQSEIVKHDFMFQNNTPKTLKITAINTSCGCTASQADKKALKPGESTIINVTFDSKGYSGKVRQLVYVNTDNPDIEVTSFIINAEVNK